MEAGAIMVIDGRMLEAQDAWAEYAQEHEWPNPWDVEDDIMDKYRHTKQIGEASWEIELEDPSEEDSLRLRLNEEYKKKYIKRRDLFLFYQYREFMDWDKLEFFVPKWCKTVFYPCDAASGQCSLECEWWPCQNQERVTPALEEMMALIENNP